MGSGGLLTLIFPILALIPGAFMWVGLVQNRLLISVHARTTIRRFVVRTIARVSLYSGLFVAVTHMLVFVGGFYVIPALDIIEIRSGYALGVSDAEILRADGQFGPLAGIHPLLWGLGHGAWQGTWAALLTALACVISLVVSNMFVALAAPVLLYFAGSFLGGAIPPWHVVLAMVVFPPLWGPQPWGYFLWPLTIVVALVVGIGAWGVSQLSRSPLLR